MKLSADEDDVISVYDLIIENFLESEVFAIKMAAIKCISFILNSDIEKDEILEARELKKRVLKKILDKYAIPYNENLMETKIETDDDEFNKVSSLVQLFSSIFCVNFIMRKPIIFEMSKLPRRYRLTDEVVLNIYRKILKFLKCDAESLFDSNSIVHLLLQWYHIYHADT